ncbi:hypothetical protein FZO89_13200 [Luteimonas viscosa]|uniref:Dolichyl-phosphate-mannose-protein mannosyltransferase n=1 Tax=Luteimonas viscosa TaxID=1132694 RepID=A0A5D4XR08_9GAMM|nr:hypothetical protein [Luteimonas viscosa]TYT27138.1 hypothetical protein FZO89_13200 [Luteimonas viscosa]
MSQPHSALPELHSALQARTSLAWLAIAAFFVFLFDPGIMSNDSIASLRQARSLEFNDWHPPLKALIWSLLDRMIAGPAGMLLAQSALFAYASAALCAHAFPRLSSRFPRWSVVAVFSLFPPAMTLVGMIWKDIWTSGFLLLALVHLFRARDALDVAVRRRHAILVVVFCFGATAFRHNALAATAGLLAGAAYLVLFPKMGQWLRLFAASVIGVVAAVLLYVGVSLGNGLIAERANPTTAIYLHDIAGVIVYSGDAENAANMVLADAGHLTDAPEQFLARIYRSYTPAAAGRIVRTSRRPATPFSINVYALDHDAESVREIHKTLVSKYPLAYLKHRTQAFVCLLQFCERDTWIYRSYVMNTDYSLPDTLNRESWQYAFRKAVLSPKLAVLYHPGFWLLVTLVGGALGFARLGGPRPSLLLFMGLSSAGLAVSLYFTSPIESFRYLHWTVLLGWTMLFLAAERRIEALAAES